MDKPLFILGLGLVAVLLIARPKAPAPAAVGAPSVLDQVNSALLSSEEARGPARQSFDDLLARSAPVPSNAAGALFGRPPAPKAPSLLERTLEAQAEADLASAEADKAATALLQAQSGLGRTLGIVGTSSEGGR